MIENYENVCIVCGCTDSKACEGGCYWVELDEEKGLGVCSSCTEDKKLDKDIEEIKEVIQKNKTE